MIALSVVLALVVAAPVATAQKDAPKDKKRAEGDIAAALSKKAATAPTDGTQTETEQIGELSAAWWQQALSEKQPPECGLLEQDVIEGDVFFLANFTGDVNAECTVTSGSMLLFPVLNVACSPQLSDPFTKERELRNECSQILSYSWKNATDVEVTVNGEEVEEADIVCVDSPLFSLTIPKGSWSIRAGFGVEGTGPAVAYGCWVLLGPLEPGEYTITIEGTFPLNPKYYGTDPETGEPFTFTQDATYTVTVE